MSLLYPKVGILRRMGWVLLIGGLLWGMGMAQSGISYSLQSQTLIAKQAEQVLWRTRVPLDNPVLEANPEDTVRVFNYAPNFTLLVFNWLSKKLIWQHSSGKLPVVDPSFDLQSDIYDQGGLMPVSLVARGKQLHLSTGTRLWQAPYSIALHFSYKSERLLVVGVSQYMQTLPFIAYAATSGTLMNRGQAKPWGLIKSGYAHFVGPTHALIAQGQSLKLYNYRKGLVQQTQLPFRANGLQESGGYFFAYRQNRFLDFVEPDGEAFTLAMLNKRLKVIWQSSEHNMDGGSFTVNQNIVAQFSCGGEPGRCGVQGRNRQTGRELWSFLGDIVKSLPETLILQEETFPMGDLQQLTLAATPVFVIVNTQTGSYRKLSFEIPQRPGCGYAHFPSDEVINHSYDADAGHIYIARQDLCGRFISTFPWR